MRMKEGTGEIFLVVRLSLLWLLVAGQSEDDAHHWRATDEELEAAKRMRDDDGYQIQSVLDWFCLSRAFVCWFSSCNFLRLYSPAGRKTATRVGQQSEPCAIRGCHVVAVVVLNVKGDVGNNKGRWVGVQLLCPRAASTSLNCRRCGVEEGRGPCHSQQT